MKRPSGKLRIIGGRFRSRLVDFAPSPGLRATPDRVRQTLFDWLAPSIEGARCLDLFAGSGALGLEALSRGAAHVDFVETGRTQVEAIRAALRTLGAATALVHQADALAFLDSAREAWDIVFVDPPFDAALLPSAMARLPTRLRPGHRVYLEWHRQEPLEVPAGWTKIREKKAGQVSYALATYSASHA